MKYQKVTRETIADYMRTVGGDMNSKTWASHYGARLTPRIMQWFDELGVSKFTFIRHSNENKRGSRTRILQCSLDDAITTILNATTPPPQHTESRTSLQRNRHEDHETHMFYRFIVDPTQCFACAGQLNGREAHLPLTQVHAKTAFFEDGTILEKCENCGNNIKALGLFVWLDGVMYELVKTKYGYIGE